MWSRWRVQEAYQSRGLGTEAAQAILTYGFNKLKLRRLISLIDPEYVPSQRVAEKIGMRFEKQARNRYRSFWIYSSEK